ncbi:X-ray radiation resistance-associated protein 1 isoform X3 [Embiotoca jacksoni]|uniref:X-ray radiation resistance-associated protein 1 isoform X3 n=1 Tax=Embiotoca jacksoni TaxID=100190 RepID=UPI0037042680
MDRTVLPNVSHQGHRRRKDGSGHWLLAYQKEEEQRYRNVNRRIKATFGNCENRTPDGPRGVILDELLLLQLHCVDHPSKLCFVDVSEKRLTSMFHEDIWEEFSHGSDLPLPELQFLNLADNKIAEEEALVAATLFPMLREIDIQSNPLTTKRRGEPPLLSYIRERLGITTKRKKTQEAVKLPLKVLTNPRWKVHKKIPKVSKNPLLMNTTRAAQIQTDKSEVVVKRTRGSEGKESSDPAIHENTEHFFITQTADAPEFERDVPSEEKETANNEEPTSPEQFTCYKMSTDAKPNPNASKLVGTQTAVRMPEHAQKKLNVYRDSKPELDSIQTPNGEKEKRIKKLPPLKPIKQPAERVDEMMKVMKENTTIKTVPLAVVLCGAGVNKEEYKEALSLLRELKTKYKRVHKKTMERAARQSLTETKTELNLHL